jgi:hypothetical protein
MALHHVSLRQACPARQDVTCIAGRARLNRIRPDSSARHLVQDALVPVPKRAIWLGTPTFDSVGKVHGVLPSILAQSKEISKGRGPSFAG